MGLEILDGLSTQWRIQWRACPPLFLDKTEARRAEKNLGRPPPPRLSRGLGDGGPTPLFIGLDLALQMVGGVR